MDGLGLEAFADQMLLLPGIGRVHVAGEQEIEPVAMAAPVADRVRPPLVDQRQVGLHAGLAHPRRRDIARRRSPFRSARNVDEVHQQRAHVPGIDMRGGLGEIGMCHRGAYPILTPGQARAEGLCAPTSGDQVGGFLREHDHRGVDVTRRSDRASREASTTRRFSAPSTLRSLSRTARSSPATPILQVPSG